jgi:hypothetical protein
VQIQDGKFRLVAPEHVAEPDVQVIWPYPAAQ